MRQWSYGLGVALFFACAQAASAGDIFPKIVVTVPALKPYTDALLDGIDSSKSLLRPGQDAHTFTISPSQREMLDNADIIIIPDRRMSAMLEPLLKTEEKRGAQIIALTSFKEAEALPYLTENPWLEAAGIQGEEEHDAKDDAKSAAPTWLDPHLWLDPIRMAHLAMPLADAISQVNPRYRARLEYNAHALADHLTLEVSPKIADVLARRSPMPASMSARPIVPFITYHAAYQYFLGRYGLQQQGEITQRPEDYLGARTLHDAIAGAGKLSIRCIISETRAPLVQRLADASGAKIVELSPETTYSSDAVPPVGWVKNDYDRLLYKTALSFADCL